MINNIYLHYIVSLILSAVLLYYFAKYAKTEDYAKIAQDVVRDTTNISINVKKQTAHRVLEDSFAEHFIDDAEMERAFENARKNDELLTAKMNETINKVNALNVNVGKLSSIYQGQTGHEDRSEEEAVEVENEMQRRGTDEIAAVLRQVLDEKHAEWNKDFESQMSGEITEQDMNVFWDSLKSMGGSNTAGLTNDATPTQPTQSLIDPTQQTQPTLVPTITQPDSAPSGNTDEPVVSSGITPPTTTPPEEAPTTPSEETPTTPPEEASTTPPEEAPTTPSTPVSLDETPTIEEGFTHRKNSIKQPFNYKNINAVFGMKIIPDKLRQKTDKVVEGFINRSYTILPTQAYEVVDETVRDVEGTDAVYNRQYGVPYSVEYDRDYRAKERMTPYGTLFKFY